MKKIIALLLAAVMCLALTGCAGGGKFNGKYVDNIGFSMLVFDGSDKISFESVANFELLDPDSETQERKVSKGTFTFEDNVLKISYDNGNSDTLEYDPDKDEFSLAGGAMKFSKYTSGSGSPAAASSDKSDDSAEIAKEVKDNVSFYLTKADTMGYSIKMSETIDLTFSCSGGKWTVSGGNGASDWRDKKDHYPDLADYLSENLSGVNSAKVRITIDKGKAVIA